MPLEALTAAEQALGDSIPSSVRVVLRECDGVRDDIGGDVLWPLAQIVRVNADEECSHSCWAYAG